MDKALACWSRRAVTASSATMCTSAATGRGGGGAIKRGVMRFGRGPTISKSRKAGHSGSEDSDEGVCGAAASGNEESAVVAGTTEERHAAAALRAVPKRLAVADKADTGTARGPNRSAG